MDVGGTVDAFESWSTLFFTSISFLLFISNQASLSLVDFGPHDGRGLKAAFVLCREKSSIFLISKISFKGHSLHPNQSMN